MTDGPFETVLGVLDCVRRTGDKATARCPAHDDQTPSLSIENKGDKALVHCHAGCEQSAVVEALKARGGWPATPAGPATRYEWINPLTGETVTQTRPGRNGRKYGWPAGVKQSRFIHLHRYDRDADRAIVWTEGARAAGFAARALPAADFDVVAFISSAVVPTGTALKHVARGRQCVVWPDDDLPGARIAQRIATALRKAEAADVRIVDPAALEIDGGAGGDAEQFRPGDDPGGELVAACGGVVDVDDDAVTWLRGSDIRPRAVPWLWRQRLAEGAVTVFAGYGDAGKSLAAVTIAAGLTEGRFWPDGGAQLQTRGCSMDRSRWRGFTGIHHPAAVPGSRGRSGPILAFRCAHRCRPCHGLPLGSDPRRETGDHRFMGIVERWQRQQRRTCSP